MATRRIWESRESVCLSDGVQQRGLKLVIVQTSVASIFARAPGCVVGLECLMALSRATVLW